MKLINFLSAPGTSAGARPCTGGFSVNEPWGEYRLGDFALGEGWYEFRTDASGAVTILYDQARFNLIELQASRGTSAYVRLLGGCYSLSIMPGARPGIHPTAVAEVRALPSWRRWKLLGGRLVQALRGGLSMPRIARLIRLALSRRSYGIRPPGAASGSSLGVLSAADRDRDRSDAELGDYVRRLEALADGPRFLIRGENGRTPQPTALGSQIYPGYTLDSAEPYDFIVTIASGDVLTPDALLLFAEHIVRHAEAEVILADKWIDGEPTGRVAWDPILYDGGLPTPFAHIRRADPKVTFGNKAAFSLLALPLASSNMPDSFCDYPAIAPADRPPCSIIIPTRDRADLLATCLGGLFDATPWPHEVIVVDNGSVEPATFALFERYAACGLKIVRADIPFNFSTLCNLGAAVAAHDYLVFLNNDVVLHRPDWLEHMMAFAVLQEAGAVGARLLYADGRLQHGGVMLGLTQVCGHLWRALDGDAQGREVRLTHSSLRSAVTAACLCVSHEKFDAVGGFDSEHFPVTLNDIDLCQKLAKSGYFNIYSAEAVAYHLESESRGEDIEQEKKARRYGELRWFSDRWPEAALGDPFMSPSVSRVSEIFSLR